MAERDLQQLFDDLIVAHKALRDEHNRLQAHAAGAYSDEEHDVHSVKLRIHIEKLRDFRKQLKVERLETPRKRRA